MKTISVQMSDVEYDRFGLSKDRFSFSELANLVERQKLQRGIAILERPEPDAEKKVKELDRIADNLRGINEEEPFSRSFGMWADRDIDVKKIRQKTYERRTKTYDNGSL